MLSNQEIEKIIADIESGAYDVADVLEAIASAAKGEDVRAALYASVYSVKNAALNGQPKIVTEAANMKNTDTKYLYFGNEVGYTYGYIYAYIDGAWEKTSLYGEGSSPTLTVEETETGIKVTATDGHGTTVGEVLNGTATDAQVETYVEDWLDEHPEATTTVQDGSITLAKLSSDVVEELSDIGDKIDAITLDIDDDDGLLYIFINGVKQGDGIEIGGSTTRFNITYNLATNIVSSNNARRISEGAEYHSVISSSDINYFVDSITVTMGNVDITSTAVNGHNIDITSVTGNLSITVTAEFFPAVLLNTSAVQVQGGTSSTFGVKLAAQPTQNQLVTLIANGVTLSGNTLTFTSSNWDTYQTVTVSTEMTEETAYGSITVRNSDPLMTDIELPVIIGGTTYADVVDMTIPEGQVTATISDFTTMSYQGGTLLNSYIGNDTNVKVPLSLDAGGKLWFNQDCFKNNTRIEYLELPPEIERLNSARFQGMTSLIGLKWEKSNLTNIGTFFEGDTSFEWWDGLELNTGITSMAGAFNGCSSLEYLPDFSELPLSSLRNAFYGCTSLKKIFGLPTAYTSATDVFGAFYNCNKLEKAIIGSNVSTAENALRMATAPSTPMKVYIYDDNLTSAKSADIFTGNTGAIVYAHKNTDTWTRLAVYVSNNTITLHDLSGGADLPLIITWGDSTTSPGTAWTPWPVRLQTKLGASNFIVRNEAVSGETTASTSARQGGNTPKIKESVTIPASGSVAVKLGSRDGRTFANVSDGGIFTAGGTFNPCTINGVEGVLSGTSGNENTFTRSEAGSAVSVSADTYFYSNNDDEYNNSNVIMLINLGTNSGWGTVGSNSSAPIPANLITQVQSMIDHFEAKGGTKYIVCGAAMGMHIDPASPFYREGNYEATLAYEALAAEEFGTHWLNLRTYGITYGLSQNGLTATAEDTERMARGCWPMQLLQGASDVTHPNAYGANTQMMAFYEKGVALGYWSAVE